MPILPAVNTLWFWFDKATRRALHGTPTDVMRKFDILENNALLDNGLEIYVDPSRLKDSKPFDSSFIKKFARLPYRSVHIGDSDINFLDQKNALDNLLTLSKITSKLEADSIIIHAHHIKKNRHIRNQLLSESLGSHDILVENNGFDNKWGATSGAITSIMKDCPDLKFCLDLAHINDFQHLKLDNFIKNPLLLERIAEIHLSYSTILLPDDPYKDKGYHGYGPFHALFSVLEEKLSDSTKEFINNYPIIMEGIVPKEDKALEYLKSEKRIIN